MVWWVWGASHTVDLTHVDDLLKSWKQTTSKSQYMLAGWATMEDDGTGVLSFGAAQTFATKLLRKRFEL